MKSVYLAIDKGHLDIVKYLMKPEQQLFSEGSDSISHYIFEEAVVRKYNDSW